MLLYVLICVTVALPTNVSAQEINTLEQEDYSPVLITEILPGTEVSGSQEFIELYNQSATTIDLSKQEWRLQIASSTASDWSKAKSIALSGLFYPGTYMLLASTYVASGETKAYLQDFASDKFASGMTATAGHVRLASKNSLATNQPTLDAIEWTTKTTSGGFTADPLSLARPFILERAIEAGTSIKRKLDSTQRFIQAATTDEEAVLLSLCPSPTANNTIGHQVSSPGATKPLPTTLDVTDQACIVDEPDGDTGIEVPTSDPPEVLLPNTAAGSTVATGIHIPASDIGLAAPQLTELLPNPATPQTDASDEFIELYNSNSRSFDLTGFYLEIGTSQIKRYVFPANTAIAAHEFRAFFSADTHISLSNSSGQVRLVDPLGNQIGQTDVYAAAKEGQTWAFASSTWQWSMLPTPNAANAIKAPVAKTTKAASSAKATSKAAATKATPKKSEKVITAPTTKPAATVTSTSPLHPGVLAVVGSFAILYGAYEYRRDVANKIYQFRSNRAARREDRQDVAGR